MLCWEKSSTFCAQSIDIDPDDGYSKTQPFLKEGNTASEDDVPEQ